MILTEQGIWKDSYSFFALVYILQIFLKVWKTLEKRNLGKKFFKNKGKPHKIEKEENE